MRSRGRSGFAVSRDQTPIFYEVAGRYRPATTLIFCDGIGCTGYVWRYLQRMLAEDYRTVHLHYRGHGQTPAPKDPDRVSVSDLADDVVTVLYFAAAREKAGLSSERLALPPDASVAELLAAVQARHPALTEVLPRCRVAIDQSFAAADARVPEGAEVALIPPVAGG